MERKKLVGSAILAAAAIGVGAVSWLASSVKLNLGANEVIDASSSTVTVDFAASDFSSSSGSVIKHGVTFDYSGFSVSGSTITVGVGGYLESHETTNVTGGSGASGYSYTGFKIASATVTMKNTTTKTSGNGILDYWNGKSKTWYQMFSQYGSQTTDSQVTSLVADETVTFTHDLNCLDYKDNGDGNDMWAQGAKFQLKANDVSFTCTGFSAKWACYPGSSTNYTPLFSTMKRNVYTVKDENGNALPYVIPKSGDYKFKVTALSGYQIISVNYAYSQANGDSSKYAGELTGVNGLYTLPSAAIGSASNTGGMFIDVVAKATSSDYYLPFSDTSDLASFSNSGTTSSIASGKLTAVNGGAGKNVFYLNHSISKGEQISFDLTTTYLWIYGKNSSNGAATSTLMETNGKVDEGVNGASYTHASFSATSDLAGLYFMMNGQDANIGDTAVIDNFRIQPASKMSWDFSSDTDLDYFRSSCTSLALDNGRLKAVDGGTDGNNVFRFAKSLAANTYVSVDVEVTSDSPYLFVYGLKSDSSANVTLQLLSGGNLGELAIAGDGSNHTVTFKTTEAVNGLYFMMNGSSTTDTVYLDNLQIEDMSEKNTWDFSTSWDISWFSSVCTSMAVDNGRLKIVDGGSGLNVVRFTHAITANQSISLTVEAPYLYAYGMSGTNADTSILGETDVHGDGTSHVVNLTATKACDGLYFMLSGSSTTDVVYLDNIVLS